MTKEEAIGFVMSTLGSSKEEVESCLRELERAELVRYDSRGVVVKHKCFKVVNFYTIPKSLISDRIYDVSAEAKLVYAVLMDEV
ncbi:hypothetical protein [Streptococcus sp. zg-JUN1979]|uniref:hypothetical protein n=1 Tax=Streptococcus sp. zg-JUN1979 TaxID=3391450 RepID=UPI0039A47678